jgi:uncharacterized protein with ParB-like and HNH nuclease domain
MSGVKIEGKEYPVGRIFSGDFVFTIPRYQRPYAWTTEESGALLGDIIAALGEEKDIDIERLYRKG